MAPVKGTRPQEKLLLIEHLTWKSALWTRPMFYEGRKRFVWDSSAPYAL
jgi:hypothetical protein